MIPQIIVIAGSILLLIGGGLRLKKKEPNGWTIFFSGLCAFCQGLLRLIQAKPDPMTTPRFLYYLGSIFSGAEKCRKIMADGRPLLAWR